MNFLEILKNSSNTTDILKNSKYKEKKQKVKQENKSLKLQSDNLQSDNPNLNEIKNLNTINTYKNIKTGDFIKIIYQKNSLLNCYKGYVGEIKEYRKEQDSALIFLHAITTFKLIKFPITHFVKLYD